MAVVVIGGTAAAVGGASAAKTAAAVAAAAASAATAYSTYRQGQTAEAIAENQAQQQRLNAIALRQKAEFEVEQQRARVRKFKGAQRFSLLASGVQLEGTALDILADTEVQARIDRDIIRHNAELAALGLEQQARISAFTGREAATAGKISAGSTLLASAGKFARRKRSDDLLAEN